MVDFRKWLLALLPAGLLLGIGSTAAFAQTGNAPLTCNAAAGVPYTLRSEGVTELLGDLILTCTGGTPTILNTQIPLQNFQISINTNVTSRIEDLTPGVSVSEALLMIDEPYPAAGAFPPSPISATPTANNAQAQRACLAINSTNCRIVSSNPGGLGLIGTAGNYNGSLGHPNIFQGYQSGVNTIAWNGVPVDAPGTAGSRFIRITNVRANAFQLGVSSTLVPTQISMIVAVSGSTLITINQPGNGNVVGNVQPGLIGSGTSASYQQCLNLNGTLLNGSLGQSGVINLKAQEGFASSFKPQNYLQSYQVSTVISNGIPAGPNSGIYLAPATNPGLQNVPGFTYVTESGFYPGAVTGLDNGATGNEPVGLADRGTQIQFTIQGVGAGVSLFAPSYVYLAGSYGAVNGSVSATNGVAVLVSQIGGGANGAVGGGSSGIPVTYGNTAGAAVGSVPVTIVGGTATLIYEIYYADPNVQETLIVPVKAAWITTGPTNPAPTTTPTTASINFAPLSVTGTASSTAPIPRFGQPYAAFNFYSIVPCTCNLLFPCVSNIPGFDTGVAIANTTADTLNGLAPQSGNVTLSYYGTVTGGGAAPPNQTTTSTVPAGSELIFTLSNGGNYGIAATPGFQGYIIARTNFQYCHGFAFISDSHVQLFAEGYLAVVLDQPGLWRTGQTGESLGN